MLEGESTFRSSPPDELGQVVRTDLTGNVDVSLVEYFLSLTPAERVEQNYQARRFFGELQKAGNVRSVSDGAATSNFTAAE
ncbi:MAG TPA: hypothetical protein VFE58_07340 [Tepidisphaeraceae bacterium]|jgi:hypothetical protein|nr:hypothetical protein [Tepidisphaeraceae bacterium]